MKNVIVLVVVLLLCLVTGCAENNSAVWFWEDTEAVGARIGTKLTENNEAGLSMLWGPDESEPRILGLYAVNHLIDLVEFRNPIIVDFLPETLMGRPYLGGKLDINFDTDETTVGPIAGIIFEETFYIETSIDKPLMFGLRAKF